MNIDNFSRIIGEIPSIAKNLKRIPDRALVGFVARISPDPETGCWVWVGPQDSRGYGVFYPHLDDGLQHHLLVHRLAYELGIGELPFGYHVHHKCQRKTCCNPSHLEPLNPNEHGRAEAVLRDIRTHCSYGHAFTAENTAWSKRGRRKCRECARLWKKKIHSETTEREPEQVSCKNGHEFTEENTYWYTSTAGYKARGCRICRNGARRRATIAARKAFIEGRKSITATPNKYCIHGHEYALVGWAIRNTGQIRCMQCDREQQNARNSAKREARGPLPVKTECTYGHGPENYICRGTKYRCRECSRLASLKYAQDRAIRYKEQGIRHTQKTRKPHVFKTHCPSGHPYDNPDQQSGRKACIQCRIDRALANGTAKKV